MEIPETVLDGLKREMLEARRDWKHAKRQLRLAKNEETFFRARCLALNDCLLALAPAPEPTDIPVYTGDEDLQSVYAKLGEIGRRCAEPAIREANPCLTYHVWNSIRYYGENVMSCGFCGLMEPRPEYEWGCPGVVPRAARTGAYPPPPVIIPADDSTPRRESTGNLEINAGDKAAAAVNNCGHTWRDAHDGENPIHLCMLCGAKEPRTLDDIVASLKNMYTAEPAPTPPLVDVAFPRGATVTFRPPLGEHSWNIIDESEHGRLYRCLRCSKTASMPANQSGEPAAAGCLWRPYV